jgi:hypothetical protein
MGGAKKSILVAEDERILARDLKATLERFGHSVLGAVDSGSVRLDTRPADDQLFPATDERSGYDPARFEALYRRVAPLIYGRARRLVGDEADDVVQEVFMRLVRDRPAEGALSTWIYRTSTNLCIDRIRARRRRSADWELEVAAGTNNNDAKDAAARDHDPF